MDIAEYSSCTSIEPGIMRYDGAVIKGAGASGRLYECLVAFEDEPEWTYMPHYFHFMEYITALIHGLDRSGIAPAAVDAVAFPNSPGETWKGSFHDHNLHLLKAFFPSLAQVINKNELGGSIGPIRVRRMLVITRKKMEHSSINKMCAGIFPKINHDKIQEFVSRVYAYCGLPAAGVAPPAKPLVTYIARNRSKRRLPPRVEQNLVARLLRIDTVEFQKVSMETLAFNEQIAVAMRTSVLIGIHGNGLTHAFFMPPKGIVVEIFPNKTFQFDYFSIATLRDHRYFAFNTNKATPFRNYRVFGSTSRRVRRINIEEIAGIVSAYRHFM
jgi:hypothetical protein